MSAQQQGAATAAAAHDTLVVGQFGPQADAYVTSRVHAEGADLARIAAVARGSGARTALDMGCGGGHVAFALAPVVAAVTASDLSAEMLAAVAAEAARRGLANVATRQARAESLPFAEGSFDFVASRFSTHHWGDAPAGLREARRVVRAGARAVFADVTAPAEPLFDTVLQTWEMLRDPSHVRNRSIAQWCAMAGEAGFRVDAVAPGRLRLEFAAWVARMRTPALHVEAIRSLQAGASDRVRRYFELEADGTFTLDTMVLEATAV